MPREAMPPHEPRPEKVEGVQELSERLRSSNGAILTDYRGMTVKALEQLRIALRAQGASYQVVKNTLMKRAADEIGFQGLAEWLEGPTAAVFFGPEMVATTKALVDFVKANANNPKIKGGFIEGRKIDVAGVQHLATLPPREILLALLLSTLQSPMGSLLSTLQAPMVQLAGTLQSLADTKAA